MLDGVPRLRALADAGDVQASASRLLYQMNGAAALVDSTYRPVKLMDRLRDTAGTTVLLGSANLTAQGRLTAREIRGLDGEVVPSPPPSPTLGPEYLAAADRDSTVREVLKLLGDGPADWFTLYKVYEVIHADGSDTRWATNQGCIQCVHCVCKPSVSEWTGGPPRSQ